MLPFNFHDHVKAGFSLAFMLFCVIITQGLFLRKVWKPLIYKGFKNFGFNLTQADDLGRVVIPKEIRRTMRIREGDPSQITLARWEQFCFAMGDLAKRQGWK